MGAFIYHMPYRRTTLCWLTTLVVVVWIALSSFRPHKLTPQNWVVPTKAGDEVREVVCSEVQQSCFAVIDITFPDAAVDEPKRFRTIRMSELPGMVSLMQLHLTPNGYRVDKRVLQSRVVKGMIFGILLAIDKSSLPPTSKILNVGVGAGAMDNYLDAYVPEATVVSIDYDPVMIDLAKRWFDVRESTRHTFLIADAVSYLNYHEEEFDFIMIDACTTNRTAEIICPTKMFRDVLAIQNMKKNLRNDGIVVLNVALNQFVTNGIFENVGT